MSQRYAPGIRVEIRDAEWRIKRIDHTSDGGELLTCVGLSELVRGREATFLTKIEPNIRILAPEDTQLIDDTSSAYRASRLYLATLIRQAPPVDEKIYLGQHAALDVMPFQFEPARRTDLTNGISYSINRAERNEQGIALGWNDIRDLNPGETVSKTYTDTTQASGPVERTVMFEAPFFKPEREQVYATAWAFFAGEGH